MSVAAGVRLSLRGVGKSFGSASAPHIAIQRINLDVFDGEFLSIFGPNGCGKTTLLHLIAGIMQPDEGTIAFNSVAPSRHSVGMVFQNYEKSLMPWRTCLDNIALPLEAHHALSKRERKEKARALLTDLGLSLPVEHYPYQMSGGQKQLTCIARAMVQQPALLLLDEPFASLDYQTRIEMQIKLQEIWKKTHVTTIFISHEIDEAIYLADRLILLTARPAHIAASFDVALARPRGLEVFSSPSFVQLRAKVLDRFTHEVKL
jgi:NitT/TauT family transport system ATP-binding protein